MKHIIHAILFLFVQPTFAATNLECRENSPGNPELEAIVVQISEVGPKHYEYSRTDVQRESTGNPFKITFSDLLCGLNIAENSSQLLNVAGKCQWGFPGNTVLIFQKGSLSDAVAIFERENISFHALGKTFRCVNSL